jgi:L-arabinose isomerase
MSEVQSFEVTKGAASGDLLSVKRGDEPLTIGLLACGYFEYWRMYHNLQGQVTTDMQRIADRLGAHHPLIYPGLVDTLDHADAAGRCFRDEHVDLLVITESTYCPDYFVHQALLHLPSDVPIVVYASQVHAELDFAAGYDQALRNSGPMGLVQLTGGLRKMDKYPLYEVVVGTVDDDEAYAELDRIIQVHTTIQNLSHMTIGVIGHVFRGMYDFNYDKTAVTGKLGPHVMDIQIRHLADIHREIAPSDPRIAELVRKVKSSFKVTDVGDDDLARSAHLAVALEELVARYKVDGLVLLGQHFIEAEANATAYLGLSELLANDRAVAVTEGDTIGCILSRVLKDFTGASPFFGEWEEIDLKRNAVMLLGHGFIDPRQARKDRPVYVKPACENWGFEGQGLGFEATYEPGPVTMTHAIHDPKGWRLLISGGELLDTEPLQINESSLIVRVDKPVKEYLKQLMQYGFSHHAIVAPGDVRAMLECFARQLDIQVCRL